MWKLHFRTQETGRLEILVCDEQLVRESMNLLLKGCTEFYAIKIDPSEVTSHSSAETELLGIKRRSPASKTAYEISMLKDALITTLGPVAADLTQEPSHETTCLRHTMHWADERDGQPGYERIIGGPDAECTCWFAAGRAALVASSMITLTGDEKTKNLK